jgi:flagellar biosynthesis protein FliP
MKKIYLVLFILLGIGLFSFAASAQNIPIPSFSMEFGEASAPKDVAFSLQILFLLTIMTLAPAIIVVLTSFTRIVIVLAFIRQALATQQIPPNQVLVSLALFLTFFVMSPVIDKVNNEAFQPYLKGEVTQEVAFTTSMGHLRDFMYRQTRPNDIALFVHLSKAPKPNSVADVSNTALIPAFILSELKTAFQLGFVIFIPFLIIDLVVASTLISMGMLLLPPILISFPFKLLLFIMVDGWHLITRSVVYSFK